MMPSSDQDGAAVDILAYLCVAVLALTVSWFVLSVLFEGMEDAKEPARHVAGWVLYIIAIVVGLMACWGVLSAVF
jgi:hypothetical protein